MEATAQAEDYAELQRRINEADATTEKLRKQVAISSGSMESLASHAAACRIVVEGARSAGAALTGGLQDNQRIVFDSLLGALATLSELVGQQFPDSSRGPHGSHR